MVDRKCLNFDIDGFCLFSLGKAFNSLLVEGKKNSYIVIGFAYRRVKIEYNIKEIATQTKPITFVRLYVYKYCVITLKLKTLHVYFNLNSEYTKL